MSNHLGFEERLAIGKRHEAEVLDRLKLSFWSVTPATETQDKAEKIDAWIRWKGVTYSVAIKWRETGYDLGIAIVRPFIDLSVLRQQYYDGTVPYDRDLQHVADLYVVANPEGIRIVTGHSVAQRAKVAIMDLAREGHWVGEGYEIKHVQDKGSSGYTSGQTKLICYMNTDKLNKVELP